MRSIVFIFLLTILGISSAQQRVAILDFENASGLSKYNGLGRMMTSTLITDLSGKNNNISFFERQQLNKLLDEQSLQKTKNFDNSTAVKFGKISGVDYVILGEVFVLNSTLVFNSRMIDVETSRVLFSKRSSGELEKFLDVQSELALKISSQLDIDFDSRTESKEVSEQVLMSYSKGIDYLDKGEIEKAKREFEITKLLDESFIYSQLELDKIIEKLEDEKQNFNVQIVKSPIKTFDEELDEWKKKEILDKYRWMLHRLIEKNLEIRNNKELLQSVGIDIDEHSNMNSDRYLFKEIVRRCSLYYQLSAKCHSRLFADRTNQQLVTNWLTEYAMLIDHIIPMTLVIPNESMPYFVKFDGSRIEKSDLINHTKTIIMGLNEIGEDIVKSQTLEKLQKLKSLEQSIKGH